MAKKGYYTSKKTKTVERYDSSYELQRFQALDESPLVKTWTKKHGIKIPYREGKKKRRYFPDILVEYRDGRKYLEEVKGYVFNKMNFARKNLAARYYCSLKGMKFRLIFVDDLNSVA